MLEEEIYVQPPEGFELASDQNKVYKLHKALYGLKQAPGSWYNKIETYLTQCSPVSMRILIVCFLCRGKSGHSMSLSTPTSIKLQALLDTFSGGNFQRPGDSTKMAFVLVANNILFGQDYCRRVTPWLLSLVEDIDAWNAFPWGHYVWRLIEDYLLKGFEVHASNSQKATRLRRQCIQKPKDFYKTVEKLESSEQGLEAWENRRNLKENRATSGMKWKRTVVALVDELSGPELMEEGDDHGNGREQPIRTHVTTIGRAVSPHKTTTSQRVMLEVCKHSACHPNLPMPCHPTRLQQVSVSRHKFPFN
ncbi:Reverse transcriptase [Theobroma cacao]|nr:Reverse transcriptase [Theobroma cacao]